MRWPSFRRRFRAAAPRSSRRFVRCSPPTGRIGKNSATSSPLLDRARRAQHPKIVRRCTGDNRQTPNAGRAAAGRPTVSPTTSNGVTARKRPRAGRAPRRCVARGASGRHGYPPHRGSERDGARERARGTARAADANEYSARRTRTRPSGRSLDLRRTIHRSVARGGTPIELAWKKRRQKPLRLVVLLDASGSMSLYTAFFVPLPARCRQQFPRGRRLSCSTTRLVHVSPSLKDATSRARWIASRSWRRASAAARGLARA